MADISENIQKEISRERKELFQKFKKGMELEESSHYGTQIYNKLKNIINLWSKYQTNPTCFKGDITDNNPYCLSALLNFAL